MNWKELITDLMGVAGIGMVGTGLWWVSPSASLTVTGLILLGLAIFAATRGDS